MPKPHTLPTLFDEVKTIEISFLKKHGYLIPNQLKVGSVHWSRNGELIGSISIRVCTHSEIQFLELDYKCNQAPVKYKVQLIFKLSNLGKGVVWYFVCPHTGKHCRKLYLVDTYFLHRTAFKGCMYECQTQGKKLRGLNNTLGAYFNTDQYYSQLYKKHFKKTYAGKPTKKYLWIMERINRSENIDIRDIERLLLT
jgi:hypothetical protein